MKEQTSKLMAFLDASVSVYHAAAYLADTLEQAGYTRLCEGDTLQLAGLTIQVIHTPGHTPGSVCLLIGDTMFSGDTLFQMSYGRIDFPTGSGQDMLASIKRLLTTLPEETMVYPGHMGPTTIAHEKKYNPLARY